MKKNRHRGSRAVAVIGIAFWLGGSACSPRVAPPKESLGAASHAVRAAEDAGATVQESADLRRAQEKLAQAQDLDASRGGDANRRNTEARRLADEAIVDAQLAEARMQAASAERATRELEATVEALRGELAVSGGDPDDDSGMHSEVLP